MVFRYTKAAASDGEMLADIRVATMRPSLEAVGRFDPKRARSRFFERFNPEVTFKIENGESVLGFFVLLQREDCMFLDHLYVSEEAQGMGIGAEVIAHVKSIAAERKLPIRLCALNGSQSNDFYLRNGFVETGRDELDTFYECVAV